MQFIVYELVGGRGYTMFKGAHSDCLDYLRDHPKGERGGSVHVRGAR